jgi:hypothetical protein
VKELASATSNAPLALEANSRLGMFDLVRCVCVCWHFLLALAVNNKVPTLVG